jgi:3'(2'), 5'-bisphosphate nucleotidase
VTAGRIPGIGGAFFLVDPLDGTNSYIKGRPSFTINVALIEERRPVFGLVYAPALADLLCDARSGRGGERPPRAGGRATHPGGGRPQPDPHPRARSQCARPRW